VLVLVLLPALTGLLGKGPAAGSSAMAVLGSVGITLAKVAAFIALMIVIGRRAVPWLLERVARTGSRELFTLSVLAVALGIAVGASALFGVSVALGAFFAGMVVNGSRLSHEAASDALPLQDAFSVLFFVAVGMLFDPRVLVRHPLEIVAVVSIVMLGKSIAALAIVLLFRYPVRTALTIAASLAQVGEFSFILVAMALSLGLVPATAQSLLVAAALLTITLNPVAFWLAERARLAIAERPRLLRAFERASTVSQRPERESLTTLHGHAVVVGFGRVGQIVTRGLAALRIPYLVIEDERDKLGALRDAGVFAVYGDATRPSVLRDAGIERARLLVVASPDPIQTREIVDRARQLNAGIATMARIHGDDERRYLEGHGVGLAVGGEAEVGRALARHTLLEMGCDEPTVDAAIEAIRRTDARPSHGDDTLGRGMNVPQEVPT
jgi:CPA2 family monovalent cation:H+ antiporter-2